MLKKVFYGKIDQLKSASSIKKVFRMSKTTCTTYGYLVKDFSHSDRIKITIENVGKEEYVKQVYGKDNKEQTFIKENGEWVEE